jgi:hypothetical protein
MPKGQYAYFPESFSHRADGHFRPFRNKETPIFLYLGTFAIRSAYTP